MDSFTETTSEGWLSRIGGAIKGVIVGMILVLVSIAVLWWNEGRTVKSAKRINFAAENVISVSADSVDEANNGKLLHISGNAKSNDILKDTEFGVSENAIKLKRNVEMYQWVEEKESKSKKKLGGRKETKTTYKYNKKWKDSAVKSSAFKIKEGHVNPPMPYQGKEEVANDVNVGALKLSAALIAKLSATKNMKLKEIPESLKKKSKAILHDGQIYIPSTLQEKDAKGKPAAVTAPNPASPRVGDLRISFSICNPKDLSVVAGQENGVLSSFATKFGNFDMITVGINSVDVMINKAREGNSKTAWLIRIIGFVLMAVGFGLVFKPLSVVADVIPLIGDFVGMGTMILALILASSISLLTISLAWIFYRPLLGIPLLLCSIRWHCISDCKKKEKGIVHISELLPTQELLNMLMMCQTSIKCKLEYLLIEILKN